jgi:hypothetical protein
MGNFHKSSLFLWPLVDNPLGLSFTPCNGIRFNQIDPDADSHVSFDAVDNLPFNFGYLVEAGFINF